MKHTAAIRYLKQKIKIQGEKRSSFRKIILERKFDEQGNRRPETGPARNALREDYLWTVRRFTRAYLLAYGFLRGKSYKAMEAKASEPSYYLPSMVLKAIHEACEADAELKAEWPIDRVLGLIRDDRDIGAPTPPPEPKAPEGLLSRIMGAIL